MAQIFEVSGRIAARTPFDPAFVSAVKKIQGRHWDSAHKVWTVSKDKASELHAIVEQFFGAPVDPNTVNTQEKPKAIADFATPEDYALYFQDRVMTFIRAMPSTSYMVVEFSYVYEGGRTTSWADETKAPVRITAEINHRNQLIGGAALCHIMGKNDVARHVMGMLGLETTF